MCAIDYSDFTTRTVFAMKQTAEPKGFWKLEFYENFFDPFWFNSFELRLLLK